MRVAVDLHAHERTASGDSRTPASRMADVMYDRWGPFTAMGFVGHDRLVGPRPGATLAIGGMEREPHNGKFLHILDYPQYDLKILAHPKRIFPDNTKEQAMRVIRERRLDGVEKWNWANGGLQYEGNLDVLEVAGSDAHSPLGVGMCHMVVDVQTLSAATVMTKIKAGEFHVEAHAARGRQLLHQVEKGAALALEKLRGSPVNENPWHGQVSRGRSD